MTEAIITTQNLSKSFPKAAAQQLLVLDHVQFELRNGEIVALLENPAAANQLCYELLQALFQRPVEK